MHLAGVVDPCTRRDKKGRLAKPLDLWGSRYLHEITRADIARYRLSLIQRGLSDISVNKHRYYLSAMFRDAMLLGHCLENPVVGIPRQPERHRQFMWIDLPAQQRLVDSMHGWRLRACVAVLLFTGLAISEWISVRLADCRLGSGAEIAVNTVRRGKTVHRRRIVPIPTVAKHELARLLMLARQQQRERVSPWRSKSGYFLHIFKAGVETAGLQETIRGFHDLRHLYATNLIRAGQPIPDVARLLGVSPRIVAACYGNHSPSSYRENARQRLDRLEELCGDDLR